MKIKKPLKEGVKRRSTQELHARDAEQKSSASEAQTDSASSYSSKGGKKVSREEIELVQSLIERCLRTYMSKDEVIAVLVNHAKIEPSFTTLVWQKLEEENAEFFNAYNVRLKLKKQISVFNQLLEQQHQLMNSGEPQNAVPPPMHNGMQNAAVSSPMGYPTMHHPYAAPRHMEPLHYGMSPYHVVDGIPAASNFYHMQHNTVNVGTAGGIKQEMAMSCTSTDSNGQFSFATDDIPRMSIDPMAFDLAFPSNICSTEGLQLATDVGDWNSSDQPSSQYDLHMSNFEDFGVLEKYPSSPSLLSDIDVLLDSPNQCDIVDDFIADAGPSLEPEMST